MLFVAGTRYSPSTRVALTEEWNGVSWAETSDVNTARSNLAGSGSTTAGLVFGGKSPSAGDYLTSTEEWSSTSNTVKTLTD